MGAVMDEPLIIGESKLYGSWAEVNAQGQLVFFDERGAREALKKLPLVHPERTIAEVVIGALEAERKRQAFEWSESLEVI
jgi:hypothetical protein